MTATRIEVAPNVAAWASDAVVGDVAIWLLTSDGLGALGHPEIVLPMRAYQELDRNQATGTLVQVLRAIAGAAANGQRVAAGGTTRFGGPVLGFNGLFYVPSAPIGEHHLPASSLVGLFASGDELTTVEQFGARRVSSWLARQTRYYPYPPWTDVQRPRFPQAPTVLADMPRLGLPGATLTQQNGALHFRLGRTQSGPMLQRAMQQLPPQTPPTFTLHEADRAADGCLVWAPNQQEAEAVAPPGSRGQSLGGCFLATANQQEQNGSQMVEDGFAYFLRDPDFARLRAAFEAQSDVTIRGDRPGDDLIVTWIDEAIAAPVAPKRVRLVGVELLFDPPDTVAKALAAYIQALVATAERTLPSLGTPYEALITVQQQIQIATRGAAVPHDAIQRCLDELNAIRSPGNVGFRAHLAIDG